MADSQNALNQTNLTTPLLTTAYTSIVNNNTNITQTNIIADSSKRGQALSFFIVVLIILIIITSILIGVWLYGRRKRKWREFLAQYDNNTDWEYEQLEDGPNLGSSRATMSPVFNMNVSNDEINPYNYSANSSQTTNNSNKSRNKINERTHIID